ncbi:MAG: NAD(P)H-hydrate dehydratase [bacterium]|nr:NAD(P)H-hydrate dehydratase [bacterium]
MRIVTAEEMASIDAFSMKEAGIPGIVLMESAGRAAAAEIMKAFPNAKSCAVLCGPGNNGGDGYAVARTLAANGLDTVCYAFCHPTMLRGDAQAHAQMYIKTGGRVEVVPDSECCERILKASRADVFVDCLFGTGLKKPIEGRYAAAINFLETANAKVVSVDMPSGVNTDTGKVMGCAVKADLTVTIGLPKRGLYFEPGASLAGKVAVAEIGFPKSAYDSASIKGMEADGELVRQIIPERKPDSHKGTCGTSLIIGGSAQYSGAPLLAARGALRAGSGLTILASLKSICDKVPAEIIPLVLADSQGILGDKAGAEALDYMASLRHPVNALCIGPGLSRAQSASELVSRCLDCDIPKVLDADALWLLPRNRNLRGLAILTPHPGEMAELMRCGIAEVLADPAACAMECANKFNAVCVLKSKPVVIADGASYWINTVGNPVLSQGGTGDVLAGIITALLAQGCSVADAAVAGVYIHGLAGDICAEKIGCRGVLATEVADHVPKVFSQLRGFAFTAG